jgi:hypothetical protein
MKKWQSINWETGNSDLAKDLGVSMETIRRNRKKYGKGIIPNKSIAQIDQASMQSKNRKGKRIRGLGKKLSSKFLALGENHFSAKNHSLIDPRGISHEISNLADFVRKNPELFEAKDLAYRLKPNRKGEMTKSTCNATAMLHEVSSGRKNIWKGWVKA